MRSDIEEACRRIGAHVRRDSRYAHTSHLRVLAGGAVVWDEHFGGPRVADVFSVTKTVVATVAGLAARAGRLPDLDSAVRDVLPPVPAGQTWRHLLSMTRGAATTPPWDEDTIRVLPGGQVAAAASAPRIDRPGRTFRYDNAGYHLLSAALGVVLGRPVADYAADALFGPLGIEDAVWPADPDGVSFGFAHLRLSAVSLGRLGELWRNGSMTDPAFAAAMVTPHSPAALPENMGYGLGIWVGGRELLASGWAGQHVLIRPDLTVVTTGDPRFDPGPPPRDALPPDWRPAIGLVRRYLPR
ncbi:MULTISPECIES: serine hydrolase domain-containing protein [Catenuloplanes]|uniref:CubicO group peptidase (Beta-lactamase class C family) n=1 Tax=Catenuloplanes niger TaxID=587534 RepID=A0AAE3ZXM1_9ACTN|nr:serine hydrolase domain-containing protein [Catenuloplanes niger]MDR7326706.1 CubicO group peptidase (beta-lactamase class C family) [Catenuloplanes niger]